MCLLFGDERLSQGPSPKGQLLRLVGVFDSNNYLLRHVYLTRVPRSIQRVEEPVYFIGDPLHLK